MLWAWHSVGSQVGCLFLGRSLACRFSRPLSSNESPQEVSSSNGSEGIEHFAANVEIGKPLAVHGLGLDLAETGGCIEERASFEMVRVGTIQVLRFEIVAGERASVIGSPIELYSEPDDCEVCCLRIALRDAHPLFSDSCAT